MFEIGIRFVVIAVCSFQLANTASTYTYTDNVNHQIVFPGPTQTTSLLTRYEPSNNTDPCEGLNYCTIKPDDYPQELFNRLFKGKYSEPVFRPTYVSLGDRFESQDVDNCDAKVIYEPLYRVRSTRGFWRTVVQAPEENFLQLVRIESCNSAGSTCFTKFDTPIDIEATCKEKYSVWEVLVSDDKGGTEKFKVDLPVCCSCFYKSKD